MREQTSGKPAGAGLCPATGAYSPPLAPPVDRNHEAPPALSPRAASVAELRGVWDIVCVRPRHEKSLAWKLLDRGVGYFVPIDRSTRTSGDRLRVRFTPLLPGYVFVCVPDVRDARWKLAADHGPSVLTFISVPDQGRLVRELGAIHRAVTSGRSFGPDFAPGRKCRVVSGDFEGMDAEVDALGKRGRIHLNVSLLGQRIMFETDVALLELV